MGLQIIMLSSKVNLRSASLILAFNCSLFCVNGPYSLMFIVLNALCQKSYSLINLLLCSFGLYTLHFFDMPEVYLLLLAIPQAFLLLRRSGIETIASGVLAFLLSSLSLFYYPSYLVFSVAFCNILFLLFAFQRSYAYESIISHGRSLKQFFMVLGLVCLVSVARMNDAVFFEVAERVGVPSNCIPLVFAFLYLIISAISLFIDLMKKHRMLLGIMCLASLGISNILIAYWHTKVSILLSIVFLGIYTGSIDVFFINLIA